VAKGKFLIKQCAKVRKKYLKNLKELPEIKLIAFIFITVLP